MSKELKRLKKAWKEAPRGAKTKLYFMFPQKYSNQKITYWLDNGKDDETISQLICDLKIASGQLTKDVIEDNRKVQKL